MSDKFILFFIANAFALCNIHRKVDEIKINRIKQCDYLIVVIVHILLRG